MLLLPPNFLKQEDKAVEFLSGIFQFLGGAVVLIGGFAASSLAVGPENNLLKDSASVQVILNIPRNACIASPTVWYSLQYHPSKHAAISWLIPVYVAPMIGAYILTTAYIFRAVVAANRDFVERLFEWETAGPVRPSKPKLRCAETQDGSVQQY